MSVSQEKAEDAIKYLSVGGLGETVGLIDMFSGLGHNKMSIDTDHAMALCELASEGLSARAALAKARGEGGDT